MKYRKLRRTGLPEKIYGFVYSSVMLQIAVKEELIKLLAVQDING